MADSDAPAPASGPTGKEPATGGSGGGQAKSSSTAIVVRESDRMRTGIPADVLDVSTASLSLSARDNFSPNEAIKIRLRNIVQRFEKEARGLVQAAEAAADGSMTLRIELVSRLTPMEVSLLKMGIASPDARPGSKWV